MGFFNNHRIEPEDRLSSDSKNINYIDEAVKMQVVSDSKTFQMEVVEPRWKLDDLILPNETVEAITQAANTILVSPIVNNWLENQDKLQNSIAVNFYGPPGTGKTCAADALSALLSLKIMRVNYADLESKFVGETSKHIRLVFRQAKEMNALLFFDEADSILSRRFTNLSQANEAYINQTHSIMMMELDQFEGVVVFATNLQKNHDSAFVRRIALHVNFLLPNSELRLRLWQMYMPKTLPRSADISLEKLTDLSNGFSPADIAIAVRQAAVMAAIRSGESRRVFFADLEKAIERIRNSQHEIGDNLQNSTMSISKTIIQPSDIPDELKHRIT